MTTEPIAKLEADPDNPREIGTEELAGLGASLDQFGDLSGIVYNARTGQLIAGHQRVRALRESGATDWTKKNGAGEIRHPKTGERFPIRIVDWDDEKSRMANLVANSPAIAGHFTEAALDQIRALEEQVGYESLRLPELEKQIANELARLQTEMKDEPPPATDQSAQLDSTFAIVITCRDEAHQRELLDRFIADGLTCRALT